MLRLIISIGVINTILAIFLLIFYEIISRYSYMEYKIEEFFVAGDLNKDFLYKALTLINFFIPIAFISTTIWIIIGFKFLYKKVFKKKKSIIQELLDKY